jgi:hypothetical protein
MTRGGVALSALTLVIWSAAAWTAPLDLDSCNRLKTEQAQLEQDGARGNLVKGAPWGKSNLAPDKLEQVKRLMEVDSQLLFRCHGKPLVLLPPDPEPAEPAGTDADAKAEDAAKAPRKAAVTPKPAEAAKAAPGPAKAAPKALPAAKKPAAPKKDAAATQSAEPSAAPKPKPKAKPKSDDAFRPPSSEPGANPFANQLAPAPKQ